MKRIIFAMLLVFTVSAFVGCNSCSNKADQDLGEALMEIPLCSHEDSMRILSQTEEFMRAIQKGDKKYAYSLLSDVEGDSVRALTPARCAQLDKQFEMFPIKAYFFIGLDFAEKDFATVSYRCKFMEAPEDEPNYPVYTVLKLRVQQIRGRDVLSLHHEEYITR